MAIYRKSLHHKKVGGPEIGAATRAKKWAGRGPPGPVGSAANDNSYNRKKNDHDYNNNTGRRLCIRCCELGRYFKAHVIFLSLYRPTHGHYVQA